MMKEYGGYIQFETNYGEEYYTNLLRLNCARNCLAFLIEARGIKKIYFPFFLCGTVKEICDRYKIDYECYHIDKDFRPIFKKKLNEYEYIYVVNYYGQFGKNDILDFKGRFTNLIVDNVQAFFERPINGVDTIYSCRKFFGVPDGAYLSTDSKLMFHYETDTSYDRMHFLLGRFEKDASDFYSEYVQNNELFDSEPIKFMSKLTRNLLKGIDYEIIKEKREKNFQYLHERLGNRNELHITLPIGPFAYPLQIKDGKSVRKKLIEKKIYIPLLWPEILEVCKCDVLEYRLACDVLPLPIDQRYNEDDMQYIYEKICETV
ncbi:MAG: hypothetical protein ACI4C4_01385 [Lachnospiraceae bacterium]